MARLEADVALLTERRYCGPEADAGDWYRDNILRDDRLLQEALAGLGISSVRVDWSRPDVDWSRFRCAVFRTTWDYFDRFAEFTAWLDRVRKETLTCNDDRIIHWNIDKHYLADLEAKGVPVVESLFIERGAKVSLHQLIDETGWENAVLKPCVSGAARHTYRVHRGNASKIESVLAELVVGESLMLQPFQRGVVEEGEDALMMFEGRFTHAVRKTPKAGDFRVQDDHGGTVRDYLPNAGQIELAERALAACDPAPAYARVDMVRDNCGQWAIMELELIEPELWLRNHPPAALAFAKAIAKVIES